jgi:cell division transport system permease protein
VTQLPYFFREAFRALVEAKRMTFVSIFTVAITLFFLTIAYLGMENVSRWVEQYNHQKSVVAYLELTLPESDQKTLLKEVQKLPGIDKASLISRSEAYTMFASLYGKELLSAVEENPFPASIEIDPLESSSLVQLEKKLSRLSGVESVSISKEWISSLTRFQDYLSKGIGVLIVIMLLALYFTITNTIKLTVYARRELVINMQYVGASPWYIRTPFILEGMIQGVCGAFIAWAGVGVLSLLLQRFSLFWGGSLLFIIMILSGAILGFLGSYGAVRKFVK